ncbi:sodium:dicarboxylate symporter [Phenylobacterium sp. Root77]|jgi:aerobic C4-dicarboxylate transport protein|uniref:C4-dicarboxylate transporter DctA n=1 Tax=unclassified Phenylobacterium TaxID=2640670 RepID=UPI0006F68BAB|nr:MULTISPECIES: C4-dicarboxylate transporter DctA [unclassified Phenylobacterium]KQW70682.1 sodium:dicarboxylate symporter [Phenylobacterium sp. Root1277]KQW90898.1 sodium:dicarboxylate symporter [Phenylobacterium sp. Root1290]KRC39471.1 sodium:dicarboxylate symporter [Phenylobacterium sp. Root77]
MGFFKVFRLLYVQVLVAIALGIAVGAIWPDFGVSLKPLGDGFIKLIKMAVAPVIFCTIVSGIARMSDIKAFGRLGAKTLIYFEVVSTLALVIGLVVGNLVKPGRGFNIDPNTLDPSIAAGYVEKAEHGDSLPDYILSLIPDAFFGAFADGALLQVLVIAILTGFACSRLGEFGDKVAGVLEDVSKVFFSIIQVIVKLAPIGAFGAMGFTIGKYGLAALLKLGALVATFYATSLLFVLIVLGLIALVAGFSIFKFLRYIREELLIVLGTSSSESVLPQMMEKMQRLGAGKTTTGLVIPTGYSFNLDGTNIYMTLATLFLAQATNIDLTLTQELTLLGVAMLTSKGASGVTGAGFITLAATLAVAPQIPIASLAILVGVDRFMSECRALTNLVGNGVATIVIARWEGDLDREKLALELERGPNHAVAEPLTAARAEAD